MKTIFEYIVKNKLRINKNKENQYELFQSSRIPDKIYVKITSIDDFDKLTANYNYNDPTTAYIYKNIDDELNKNHDVFIRPISDGGNTVGFTIVAGKSLHKYIKVDDFNTEYWKKHKWTIKY